MPGPAPPLPQAAPLHPSGVLLPPAPPLPPWPPYTFQQPDEWWRHLLAFAGYSGGFLGAFPLFGITGAALCLDLED